MAISGALRVGLDWSETRRYLHQDQQFEPLGSFNSDPFFGQSPIEYFAYLPDRGCHDCRFAMSDSSHPHHRAGQQFRSLDGLMTDSYEAG